MNLPIFSVKDKLIGFGTTFTATNTEVAMRGFRNSIFRSLEVKDDSVSPEDLSLYMVGEFDTDLGTISSCEPLPLLFGHVVVTEYYANSRNCNCTSGGDLDDNAL